MPRCARKRSENQIYHIMLRGNNKEEIFIDEEDKSRIIEIIEEKKKFEEYYLYAYCVMDNHLHIIVKECKDTIARIVKRIATSYSYYFNKKYKRIGHVFQERFKSESIEDESYLLTAIRYVHQNPEKAGISKLESYRWSSYSDYIGKSSKKTNTTDTSEILGIISNNYEQAVQQFIRFNLEFTEEIFLDIGESSEIDENNVVEYIGKLMREKKIEISDLRNPDKKALREEVVKILLEKSNLSQRRIAVVLGLGREMVRRIVVSTDLSR